MKNVSVNMINTRSTKEQKTKEKLPEEPNVPVMDIDLETPDHSIDGAERKTTESTPMPNVEEQGMKKIEFSPIGNGGEIANNTPETIKDDSQNKRTSFTESLVAMVGMKTKGKKEMTAATEKSKLFGTVSAITTETKQDKDQVTQGTAGNQDGGAIESKVPSVDLADLMTKLEQIDKKLKCGKEDGQELKKELRHNKSEYLNNYFVLARSTEERLHQMADKVDTTYKERENKSWKIWKR